MRVAQLGGRVKVQVLSHRSATSKSPIEWMEIPAGRERDYYGETDRDGYQVYDVRNWRREP